MQKQPNKKKIGLFLVLGFIVLFLIIGKSLASKFGSNDTYMAVMYFDESIKGLHVGAPVVFNGVEIGKVAKIELVGDPDNLTFKIPVYARIKPMTAFQHLSFWSRTFNRERTIKTLIAKGLRAQLLTQSLLTGQLLIELSMKPDTELKLVDNRNDDIVEIPTVLSQSSELSRELQNISLKETLQKLDHILSTLETNMPVMLPALAQSAQNLEKATGTLTPMGADIMKNLNTALNNTSDAMRSLRNFAEYVERYPESLLKGKK